MKRTILAFLGLVMLLAQPVNADIVLFDFTAIDGQPLEGGAGGTLVSSTGASGITATLTSVLVTAPEYDAAGMATGVTLNADLNATGGGNFGINNPSVSNAGYNTIAGVGNGESSNFNFGEAFTFVFDEDVTFTNFDFASTGANDSFDVTIGGTTTNFIADTANPLGTQLIPAGTSITFTSAGSLTTSNARINSIEVDIAVAVPEPTAFAVLGFGSVLMATRRRRR